MEVKTSLPNPPTPTTPRCHFPIDTAIPACDNATSTRHRAARHRNLHGPSSYSTRAKRVQCSNQVLLRHKHDASIQPITESKSQTRRAVSYTHLTLPTIYSV